MPRVPQIDDPARRGGGPLPFQPRQPVDFSAFEQFGANLLDLSDRIKTAEDNLEAERINAEVDSTLVRKQNEIANNPDLNNHTPLAAKTIKDLDNLVKQRSKGLVATARAKVEGHIIRQSADFEVKVMTNQVKARKDALTGRLDAVTAERIKQVEDFEDEDQLKAFKELHAGTLEQTLEDGAISQEEKIKRINEFNNEADKTFLLAQAIKSPSTFLASRAGLFDRFKDANVIAALTRAREDLNQAETITNKYNEAIRDRALTMFQTQALRGRLNVANAVASMNANQIKPTDMQTLITMNQGANLTSVGSGGGSNAITAIELDLYSGKISPEALRQAKAKLMTLAGRGVFGAPTKDGRSTQLHDAVKELELRAANLENREVADALRQVETEVADNILTTGDVFQLKRKETIRRFKQRILDTAKDRAKEELDAIKRETRGERKSSERKAVDEAVDNLIER